MKSKTIVLILAMMSALIWTTFNGPPVISQVTPVPPVVPFPSGPFEKFGPRVDRLTFVVSGTVEREMDDFKNGMFDILEWAAPAPEWDNWLTDPTITMGNFSEMSCEYLAFNNGRWPLGHSDMLATGWTSFPTYVGTGWQGTHNASLWKKDELWGQHLLDPPGAYPGGTGTADWAYIDYNCTLCMSARQYRRGLAHLYDRTDQMTYMQGAGEDLSPSLFWPPLKTFWENPSAPTYDFSLDLASDAFVAGGFKDWNGDTVMEYSPSNGSVPDDYVELPSIKFYTRIDDDHRNHAAKVMSFYMDVGLAAKPCGSVPHTLIIATRATVDTECWAEYDYDIYTEYWDWGPTPDFYAEWFASFGDIYPEVYAYNFHRYHNLEFDQLADALVEAPNLAAAKAACDEMQMILHGDCASVPQFHYIGYQGRRTAYSTWPGEEKYAGRNWTNTNCYEGEGWYSWWNILNSQVEGFERGGTLRHGMNGDADNLDIIDSWYTYDALVLQNIYGGLLVPDPHDVSNISAYIPWDCQSYEIGTWEHPTEGTCTAMNFTLIPGTLWQDGTPMTADDVGFSFWFSREARSVTYGVTKDFAEYVTYDTDPGRLGNETVEIRFRKLTWLAPVYVWGTPIIPKHIWSDEEQRYCPVHEVMEYGPGPDGSAAWRPEDHDALIGTGPFRFYKDGVVGRVDRVLGEYVYLEANPLYFRKYVEPDVGDDDDPTNPAAKDGEVDLFDFLIVAVPEHIFQREDDNGQWGTPPGAWGEPCDVNKDGKIGVGDLMEIGVHFAESWPPVWYEW